MSWILGLPLIVVGVLAASTLLKLNRANLMHSFNGGWLCGFVSAMGLFCFILWGLSFHDKDATQEEVNVTQFQGR